MMPMKGTADPIGRTFKIIKLFERSPNGVTVGDIQKALECSDFTARYFLDHASIHMPICLEGKLQDSGKVGQKPMLYRLLKYSESWAGKEVL
jgi:hypothetical protein